MRRTECRRVFLFFVYFFLTVGTTVIGKTARNTFFLSRFDPTLLPWTFVVIAVVTAAFMPAYGRLGRLVSPRRLAATSGVVFALGTLAFTFAQAPLAYGALYVWIEVGTTILFFEYWMLAGRTFRAREAKRVFGLIGSGAGAANILVGLGLGPTVGRFGAGFLIPATAVAALATVAVALAIPSRAGRDGRTTSGPAARPHQRRSAEPSSPVELRGYLRLLGVAGAASTVVFAIVDYQFKVVAGALYGEADMARLFGFVYAATGAGALLTQLVVTPRVLTRFGVVAGLLTLPVSQLLGAVALLWQPGLVAAIFLRASDRSFRFTIDQASRQVLWLPLDGATRQRAKPVFDESIRHLALGAAGVLMLLSGGGVRRMALVAIPFILLWLAASSRLSRLYVDRLREAVSRHRPVFAPLHVNPADPEVLAILRQALHTRDDAEALYVLGLIEDLDTRSLSADIRDLWRNASPPVRQRIVDLAETNPDVLTDEDLVESASDTGNPALAAAALSECGRRPSAAMVPVLLGALESPDPRLRVAAAAALAVRSQFEAVDLDPGPSEILHRELRASSDTTRVAAARALRTVPGSIDRSTLRTLLEDPSAAVREVALRATAEDTESQLLPEIVANLRRPGTGAAATRALEAQGAPAVSHLTDWLTTQGRDCLDGYRALADVVEASGPVGAADIEANLYPVVQQQRAAATHALGLLGELQHDRHASLWREHLTAELVQHVEALCCLAACLAPGHDLAQRASMLRASATARSDVLEHMDNVMDRQVAAWLVPLLEELATGIVDGRFDKKGKPAKTRAAGDGHRTHAALARLSDSPIPWERMVAYDYCRAAGLPLQGEQALVTRLEQTLFLKTVPLFAGLGGDQAAAVADIAEDVQLLAGETLFQEGAEGTSLYVIRSGSVELTRGDTVVGTLERGDCLGEFAVLDGKPRTATALALDDTELLRIDRDDFLDAMAAHPAILEGVLAVLTARIRELIQPADGDARAAPTDS